MTSKDEKNVKVIVFDKSYQSSESENRIKTQAKDPNNQENTNSKKCSLKKKVIIGVSICIAIALIIVLCVKLIPDDNDDDDDDRNPNSNNPEKTPVISEEEARKLGSEFNFTTKEGDLQRISVTQKIREDRVIDGQKVTNYTTRLTNYDIYIISEKDSDEENKYYYDKIYECSISIQSECSNSTDQDCTPKPK